MDHDRGATTRYSLLLHSPAHMVKQTSEKRRRCERGCGDENQRALNVGKLKTMEGPGKERMVNGEKKRK